MKAFGLGVCVADLIAAVGGETLDYGLESSLLLPVLLLTTKATARACLRCTELEY